MTESKLHAVDVSTADGVVTAAIVGPVIEEHRAEAIRATVLDELGKAGAKLRSVVLDLGEITFINSSGIGVCVELRNAAERRGAECIMYRPGPEVADCFRKSKMDSLFSIVETPGDLEIALTSGS
jgi:stage II sporulation protein AA (anti-sigma F factor antagonist)